MLPAEDKWLPPNFTYYRTQASLIGDRFQVDKETPGSYCWLFCDDNVVHICEISQYPKVMGLR